MGKMTRSTVNGLPLDTALPLSANAAHRNSDETDRDRVLFRGNLHTILSHLIIPAFTIFLIAGSNNADAQELAQQREGEILQQLERDRRDQQLEQKEKEQKKPPVIIKEDKKEPTGEKPETGLGGGKEKQD